MFPESCCKQKEREALNYSKNSDGYMCLALVIGRVNGYLKMLKQLNESYSDLNDEMGSSRILYHQNPISFGIHLLSTFLSEL